MSQSLNKLKVLVAILMTIQLFVESSSTKFISEFRLDELTNADSSFQPVNFHGIGSKYGIGSTSSADGLPNQQQQQQQPQSQSHLHTPFRSNGAALIQPNQNRIQLLEQALASNNRQSAIQSSSKRGTGERKTCHPTKPFLCPSDEPQGGECIPIQYLCDGSSDCPAYSNSPGGYDEDPLLCTAAKRPPVEETANFLRTLITNHGPQYIEKLFGPKISQALVPLGGPERVAIALSVSKTIDDFGKALHLMRTDIEHLRSVLVAVQTMDGPMLKNLGIVRNSELADMKFFLEKLLSTGFLD